MSNIDRILNHIIKMLLLTITCIMLIIGLIFVTPVYAVDTTLPIPIVQDDINDIKSNGIPYNIYKNQPVYMGSLAGEYTCCYVQPATVSGAAADFIVFSQTDTISDLKTARYTGYTWEKNNFTFGNVTQSGDIYYGLYGVAGIPENDIPIFGSLEDALAAVGGSDDEPIDLGPKEFDIPAGYAFYILTNGGSATLTTKFTVYNNIFTGGWSGANQRIGISETRVPSSGYTFGSNTGTIIPWSKLGTADSNILGQTYYGQFIYNNCPDNGNYLVIYNPVYAYDDDVTSNVNGTIHVEITNFVGANRFALRSSLGFNGSVDSVSPDDYAEFESTGAGSLVIGDGSSLKWYPVTRTDEDIDPNSGSTAPAPTAPYNDTSSVPDNNTFLGNLVERIVSFLEAPISHIKSLQDAASNFMGWLANLWQWMPDAVVVVIVDALIVLIVIGVIKFLWK